MAPGDFAFGHVSQGLGKHRAEFAEREQSQPLLHLLGAGRRLCRHRFRLRVLDLLAIAEGLVQSLCPQQVQSAPNWPSTLLHDLRTIVEATCGPGNEEVGQLGNRHAQLCGGGRRSGARIRDREAVGSSRVSAGSFLVPESVTGYNLVGEEIE